MIPWIMYWMIHRNEDRADEQYHHEIGVIELVVMIVIIVGFAWFMFTILTS